MDIVGWAVFSLSTFLAFIVTAVIVVAVVASQKRRNKKPVTGVLVCIPHSLASLNQVESVLTSAKVHEYQLVTIAFLDIPCSSSVKPLPQLSIVTEGIYVATCHMPIPKVLCLLSRS